jgi:hypothetical protein
MQFARANEKGLREDESMRPGVLVEMYVAL